MSAVPVRVNSLQASILNGLRDRRRAGEIFPVEPILVSSFGLTHGKLTSIYIGGFGPDLSAPAAYPASGTASDLVGGVYLHPRIPAWYVREEFSARFEELQVTAFLREQLGPDLNLADARSILWAIMQVYG